MNCYSLSNVIVRLYYVMFLSMLLENNTGELTLKEEKKLWD